MQGTRLRHVVELDLTTLDYGTMPGNLMAPIRELHMNAVLQIRAISFKLTPMALRSASISRTQTSVSPC